MPKLGAIDMPGKSGALYKFIAYSLDTISCGSTIALTYTGGTPVWSWQPT